MTFTAYSLPTTTLLPPGVLADLKMDSDKKVKLDGTKYDLASTTTVYVDGVKVTTDGEKTIKDWVTKYGDGGSNKFAKPYLKGTKVELLATDGSSDYSILNVSTYETIRFPMLVRLPQCNYQGWRCYPVC